MGRKLTNEEWADPDFQALFVALEKASKPLGVKPTGAKSHDSSAPASPETAPHSEPSPPVVSGR
jgi:hypothetical protein